MVTVNVSEARANLRSLLERVKRGEDVELTQNGATVAVLVHPSKRVAGRPEAQRVIEAGRKLLSEIDELRGKRSKLSGALTPERADEMVRELRAERDAE